MDTDYIEDLGNLAKVHSLNDERTKIWFNYVAGGSGKATFGTPCSFEINEHILVDIDNDSIISAPPELIPKGPLRVGVIKIILPDTTVVDAGGAWQRIPVQQPSETRYKVGNTVEYNSTSVVRVLHEQPLRLIEFENSDTDISAQFRAKPQNLSFSDIGGMDPIIKRAREVIEIPLTKSELFVQMKVRPASGMLFTGPPGTGKTLLARTIASTSDATFYIVNGPEIVSKWVGQSEAVLRAIFNDAKDRAPSIIFFDEIDSIAGRRSGESHDSSHRLVAQLLTLIDGFERTEGVYILAATNRPEDIDAALRRPGRFDSELHFPYPDKAGRLDILAKTSKMKNISSDLPLEEIAEATEEWSGADLTTIWAEAALLAAIEDRGAIHPEDMLGGMQRVAQYKRSKRSV